VLRWFAEACAEHWPMTATLRARAGCPTLDPVLGPTLERPLNEDERLWSGGVFQIHRITRRVWQRQGVAAHACIAAWHDLNLSPRVYCSQPPWASGN